MIATMESTLPVPNEIPLPPSLTPSMPPSPRDLEVYEFVAVRSKTTREAAAAFGISQTRVRQVLARVVEFLVQVVPADDDEHTQERKLAAAQWAAGMRLDFLYGQAMEMWRKSQEPTQSSPIGLGKVCYLNQAMRVALAAAKVPMRSMPALLAIEEQTEKPIANPPLRDCSENVVSRDEVSARDSQAQVANEEEEPTCRTLDEIKAEARRSFLRPAQATSAEHLRLPEGGAADTTNSPPLSRKERRRRERMLARATKP
jgi:hypothetical protein